MGWPHVVAPESTIAVTTKPPTPTQPEQNDDAGFTIEAPASSLTRNRDQAILILRLGLAVNSLRASHRHFLAVKDAPGPGGERDRLWAFLSATAYVKEAMNILSGTKKARPQKDLVESLARQSGAADEMVKTINQLLAGTHSMSAVVTRVRNKLTFHWDPESVGEWVDGYDKPNVIWFDASGGTSNGDTLYRAAADSIVYSIVPLTDAEIALPPEQRDRAVLERFKQSLVELTKVMSVLADYFERAIATVLRDTGAKPKPLAHYASRDGDEPVPDDELRSPQGPLFGDRIPFAQLINQERQEAVRRAHDGLYHALGHYQQMMLLEAAIIGLVIPVLYAQGPALVNPWFLRRAVAWLGVSMFVGVLIAGVSKWAMVFITARLQEQFARQDEAIGAGDDESSVAASLRAANDAFKPEARKLLRLAYSGIIGDVLFYGPFLAGLYYLLSGFLRA
jgi:hypothetical protein